MTVTGSSRFKLLKQLEALGANLTEQQVADAVGIAVVAQAEAEAGTATTIRFWTAERVKQAIAALESGAGAGLDTTNFGGILSASEDTIQKALDVLDDIFGSAVTITGNITASGGDIEAISTDAGSSPAPTLSLYRNSASPAASDNLGIVEWNGEDSIGNKTVYASLTGDIRDPTNGSEEGQLVFRTVVSGSLSFRMNIRNGMFMRNASGGDPGAGKINAQGYEIDGTSTDSIYYTRTADDDSGEQTVSTNTVLTVAHGLGSAPTRVEAILRCKTADLGWGVGDEIMFARSDTSTNNQGVTVGYNSTNIYVVQGANIPINRRDGTVGNTANITTSSWRWIVRAWT